MTTSVALSPVAILQFFDNTGKPAVGGSLLTQVGGVNYPTYSDNLGTTALPNPIPLNSRGEVSTAAGASSELFLQTGVAYTFTLSDADGNQLWSVGNITSNNGQAVSFPTASGSANAQVVTNSVPISLGNGTLQWFLPVAANTAAMTLNIDNTGAKNVLYLGQVLTGNELQLSCPVLAIYNGTAWNIMWTAKGPQNDYYADTGSANALVITAGYAFGYTNGQRFKVKAANTTTLSTAVFQANTPAAGKSALKIFYSDGTTQLTAGAIIANNIYTLTYNSSLDGGNGGWVCSDPSGANGSFTATATGHASDPTGTVTYEISSNGNVVYVNVPSDIAAVSNSTSMTITGIPSILAPITSKTIGGTVMLVDAGTRAFSNIVTGTSTTWTCKLGAATIAASFTAAGSKGIVACQFSYTKS